MPPAPPSRVAIRGRIPKIWSPWWSHTSYKIPRLQGCSIGDRPCVWVMKILPIFPIFSLLRCSWCCVASPQSNSHSSPPRRRPRAEWLRVDDGWAEAVPRKVMLTAVRAVCFDLLAIRLACSRRENIGADCGRHFNRNAVWDDEVDSRSIGLSWPDARLRW